MIKNNKPLVIAIGGPTASGKSGLAMAIAEKFNGVIINFDSLQIYNGLQILTASPNKEDLGRIEHRLYSTLEPSEQCSASIWRNMALREIESVIKNNKTPILVGGTGFYLKALLEGLSPIPEANLEIRNELIAMHKELGTSALFELFAKEDPLMAEHIDKANTQRIIRAWEVLKATGKSLYLWQQEPLEGAPENLAFFTMTIIPEREYLYEICDKRFGLMLKEGAIEQVKDYNGKFQNQGLPLEKALGYKELTEYIEGLITLDEASDKAKQITRNYAKRQVTWFKHQINPDIAVTNLKAELPDIIAKLESL